MCSIGLGNNKSITNGLVPQDWKLANVTPIFKKGSKGKPENYSPVSLTSIPCKLIESVDRNNKKFVYKMGILTWWTSYKRET